MSCQHMWQTGKSTHFAGGTVVVVTFHLCHYHFSATDCDLNEITTIRPRFIPDVTFPTPPSVLHLTLIPLGIYK